MHSTRRPAYNRTRHAQLIYVPHDSSENRLSENKLVPPIRSGHAIGLFERYVRTKFAAKRVQPGFRRILRHRRSTSRAPFRAAEHVATRVEARTAQQVTSRVSRRLAAN